MSTGDRIFAFGPFTLDVTARLLALNRQPLAIGSRSFDILVALVERRGEVVPKEDLFARAWPNVRVEERNLKVHVSALRRCIR